MKHVTNQKKSCDNTTSRLEACHQSRAAMLTLSVLSSSLDAASGTTIFTLSFEILEICLHHECHSSLPVPCGAKPHTNFIHSVICLISFVCFCCLFLARGQVAGPAHDLLQSFVTTCWRLWGYSNHPPPLNGGSVAIMPMIFYYNLTNVCPNLDVHRPVMCTDQ